MKTKSFGSPIVPEYKEISYTKTNPVSGTIYPVLTNEKYVIIDSIAVMVTWTVQPNPLECWVTIDSTGTQTVSQANPVSATWYKVRKDWPELVDYLGFSSTGLASYRSANLRGRDVSISVEITGGTVQNLNCIVKYHQF